MCGISTLNWNFNWNLQLQLSFECGGKRINKSSHCNDHFKLKGCSAVQFAVVHLVVQQRAFLKFATACPNNRKFQAAPQSKTRLFKLHFGSKRPNTELQILLRTSLTSEWKLNMMLQRKLKTIVSLKQCNLNLLVEFSSYVSQMWSKLGTAWVSFGMLNLIDNI